MARRNSRKRNNEAAINDKQKAVETKEVEEKTEQEEKVKITESPEVKVEEKKEVKETPRPSIPQSPAGVQTVEGLIEKAKKDAALAPLANRIERFIKITQIDYPDNGPKVASATYDFYVGLKEVLAISNYSSFKKKFDFINALFNKGRKDRFSPVTLSRHDIHWTHGADNRLKYAQLVEFISAMSDVKNRKSNLKRFNVETILKAVPNEGKQNVIRYYGL